MAVDRHRRRNSLQDRFGLSDTSETDSTGAFIEEPVVVSILRRRTRPPAATVEELELCG